MHTALGDSATPPITTQNVMTWKQIAEEFHKRWNFPICIGTLARKHIRLTAPALSGSRYFGYKGFQSIFFLAVVDAQERFVVIDVGAYGGKSSVHLAS